jgi:hypothetical protein
MTPPKHDSIRDLLLPPDLMAEIEKRRGNGTRFIWNATRASRPLVARLPLPLVGVDQRRRPGAASDRRRRHDVPRHAPLLGVVGAERRGHPALPGGAALRSHSDGGKLLTETYAKPDHERAMRAALDAAERLSKITDLSAERARRRA